MSQPLAYFISFTCKGARFHGDPRGTVDRDHNVFGGSFLETNHLRVISEAGRMGHQPIVLASEQRKAIEATIQSVADFRNWTIHGLAVRSNHVHVVVSAPDSTPEAVMEDFKAYATRRLRDAGLLPRDVKPWTRHGSTIYLWKPWQVASSVDYVIERQDDGKRFQSEPRP